MAERLAPTQDSIAAALVQFFDSNYFLQIGDPLIRIYSEREIGATDPRVSSVLLSLDADPLQVKDINVKHMNRVAIDFLALGSDMFRDIELGKLDGEVLTERSRTGFWLFSKLAWLEVTRRWGKRVIDANALFRTTEIIFRERFGKVFEERPLEEKVNMFNNGFIEAFNSVHESGFTTIGS